MDEGGEGGDGWRGGGQGVEGWVKGEGWELRYSAVRTGSVRPIRAFKVSGAAGSVDDTLRYAIKVLL